MLSVHKKTAVVLFQLGGPDSLEAVEPFLFNLFMDPDIIDFPLAFLARRPLATLISSRRSQKVQNNYKMIGGKSPILESTRLQANALNDRLTRQGIQAHIFIAMRYWHPMTEEVVLEIQNGGFALFPHPLEAKLMFFLRILQVPLTYRSSGNFSSLSLPVRPLQCPNVLNGSQKPHF